ncbi:MAG: DUF1460 domain-containing protein [Ignavibacteriaceae bacterium]
MKKYIFFLLIIINSFLSAQVYSDNDVKICNDKFKFAVDKNLSSKPVNEVITEIARSFIGTAYEASALEADGEEQLVINLTGLDCTTFLENALVLARLVKQDKTRFNDYQNELTYIRYREGKIDQYPSRLHYFSDWIYDNIQKGVVKDVTKEIGGEKIKFNLNFMSTHPQSYKHLKENPSFVTVIKKQEEEINSRQYYYIPRNKVARLESKIQSGDLIAITTSIKGLDIGHVGIAVKEKDGRIHLLHAPTVGSKVHITKEPLPDYLMNVKKHSGIIVLRAVEL